MLKFEVILLPLVKSTKNKNLSLESITTGSDSSRQATIRKRDSSENGCF
jgi:hypothetical protein